MMKYHRGDDGWGRSSYPIPSTAVAGLSYTGDAPDSPAPYHAIKPELDRIREALKQHKIQTRLRKTQSGNCFMVKVWVCVPKAKFEEAQWIANQWLKDHERDTYYIHDNI